MLEPPDETGLYRYADKYRYDTNESQAIQTRKEDTKKYTKYGIKYVLILYRRPVDKRYPEDDTLKQE